MASYALTSGPVQPEAHGFQPAGVSDMVDLFSGDFKYNIPLLDIDGYPINLSYQSGVGMDDEASWVGLGWSLNTGSINRSVRGLPDDFSGDSVTTDHDNKPKITVGGRLTAKLEVKGKGKILTTTVNGSLSVGVFNDNYTGIGAEVGANAGISVQGGGLTAGLGVGILSNTTSGVDLSPSMNVGLQEQYSNNVASNMGLNASLGYNTRSGMKSLTLGSSFGVVGTDDKGWNGSKTQETARMDLEGSSKLISISYNTPPVIPRIQIPYTTTYNTYSLDAGPVVAVVFAGGGITGYKSVTKVENPTHVNPAYGFLYAENGKDKPTALMDFVREKDNPIVPDLPNLALPVQMPDIFSFTSQGDAGQFRLYRGGSGAFFDNQVADKSSQGTYGIDLGFGAYFHGGVTEFHQTTLNTTRKWTSDNQYIKKGDFQSATTTNYPNRQHVYFKRVGEKTAEDANMVIQQLKGTAPLAVSITGKTANAAFTNNVPMDTIRKNNRQVNSTEISYLTANEAALFGLDKYIRSYHFNDSAGFTPPVNHTPVYDSIARISGYRKPHHISEITVTDESGKRSVYGVPVYNIEQNEYSFAVGNIFGNIDSVNQVRVDYANGAINHNKGIDYYYHHDKHPAYATSYLLSAILSPDYVDKTGNGITPDDQGTAIKFNYSKTAVPYQWRTPFHNATLNKCQLADRDDDKGSIVYGKKELWYMSSIETKTKIVYFITSDRYDGLGVTNMMGTVDSAHFQKKLSEIRIYSKSDMSKPIKVVKFQYNYQLCPGVPNARKGVGKLTLTRVWFEYGNTAKGKYHPYVFSYTGGNARYGNVETDRWGIFKPSGTNGQFNLDNEQFPYTVQDLNGGNTAKNSLDQNAAQWHLNQINLPTGGIINVTYESDDYAYVQNKQAMTMVPVGNLITDRNGTATMAVGDAQGVEIARQESDAIQGSPIIWFKNTYLDGSDYLYTKLKVDVSTSNSQTDAQHHFDFIPCYAKVKDVNVVGSNIMVMFEPRVDSKVTANPMVFSAWQIMKNEYPRYAYPGFDRRIDEQKSSSIASAISAIASAIGDLSELTQNFYQKAQKRKYAGSYDPHGSYVRVTKVNGYKLGGGVRVKKIRITDEWKTMAGNNNGIVGGYGQQYDYTTTENGKTISSGVAAYEPTLGNDENPLHQPVPYVQSIKGTVSNFFDLEEPFGESFFPGASVGYSKVTVTDLDNAGDADPGKRTGYIVNEFYTAKDYPVKVDVLPLVKTSGDKGSGSYSFLGATAVQEAIYSQGYAITLNDMHGKPKAQRVFNQSGSEISSTVTYYKSQTSSTGEMQLVNNVDAVDTKGCIHNEVLGRDVEFFTDMREQESQNSGQSIDIGVDVIPAFFFPIPIPHWPKYDNSEYKLFRSACGVKINQYYGIVDKVVKTVNGSSITTQNLVFDRLTGSPVVTHTQNEFNKDIYSVNMPAYWVYPGMSGAYQNLGIVATDLQTDANGAILASAAYNTYLQPGDEIVDISTGDAGRHYWVIAAPANTGGTLDASFKVKTNEISDPGNPGTPPPNITGKMLIDRTGAAMKGFNPQNIIAVKFVRSGFRNILGANTSSIVCLNNPVNIIYGKLQLVNNIDLTSLKVINASTTTYDESWAVEASQPPPAPPAYVVVENKPYPVFSAGVLSSNITVSNYWRDSVGNYVSPNTSYFSSRKHLQKIALSSSISDTTYGSYIGFDTCITVKQSKYYSIGTMNSFLLVDGLCAQCNSGYTPGAGIITWNMNLKRIYLQAGQHVLTIYSYPGFQPNQTNYFALELYDNTAQQLLNADSVGTNINVIYQTSLITNKPNVRSFYQTKNKLVYHYINQNGTVLNACSDPLTPLASSITLSAYKNRNPYVTGFFGNWRPYQTKVFQQKRRYDNIAANKSGIDLPNAGYIDKFSPYWYYSGGWTTDTLANRARWVNANTVTLYDKYGQQLENKDALGRYSAARFDFNGELPSAVASNAMSRDVYVSSFEDVKFKQLSGSPDTGVTFKQTSGGDLSSSLSSTVSHSGNYSLQMPSTGITLKTNVYTLQQKTQAYLDRDSYGQYITKNVTGLYPNGFEPNPNKQYIFNAWVKDSAPTTTTVPITLTASANTGSPLTIALTCKAIVEGWKLVEGTINMAAFSSPSALTLNITGNGVYIDDIRIHPFDAHLKTYAYDDATLRLMAELDENCFATFYEYDDEGLLIRVKKETERGIMTLKETRSSYKKITP